MLRFNSRIVFCSAAVAILLLLASNFVVAQKVNKFEDALERSSDAGRVISLLALVPDSGLPKELMDKAQAVAIFPKVKSETAYFFKLTSGAGVVSSRLEDGWSMPAYYEFDGGSYTSLFKSDKTHSVILLFMTKDAVGWFEKGGVALANEKKTLPGPVGTLTDEKRKQIEGAHVFAYAYYNGKLDGKAFGSSFWKKFVLDPDNKINKPLYGIKGREVLAGAKIGTLQTVPAGISQFRDALEKYYSANVATK